MENILKPEGMLCNVRKMIRQIIVCNRVKDDCNVYRNSKRELGTEIERERYRPIKKSTII